jgi:dTDP-4-amino-4,6-dideoxygalactose transaminase
VIVSPFTFVASAHALLWQGVTPVFCDVDPETHNLDPARVEEVVTPATAAILGVHLWGRPSAVGELTEIAGAQRVHLLFDAAQAFGCSDRGRMVGSFGAAEVFSFHATKVVNSFEGGAIVTDDHALADELRLLRNFGFSDYDEVVALGTNAKLTEAAAAMGLTSLESRERFFAANARNHDAYRAGLADLDSVKMVDYADGERANRQYVVVEIDESAALTRDELQQVLWAENILARRYFYPGCHRMEPYRTLFPDSAFPQAERLARRVLVLPTGASMTVETVDKVVAIIRSALADGHRLKEALRAARS